LRTAVSWGKVVPVVGLLGGVLFGAATRGVEGWVFALLVLSAAVTAIAQQTLP
jgi:hypothetical protein